MAARRVHIETYGCSFNQSDSEVMAGVLRESGFVVVADPAEADVIVLNTCTVKDRTYRNFEKRFADLRTAAGIGSGPALVLAGCIPKANTRAAMLEGVAAVGPDMLDQVANVVEAASRGQALRRLERAAPEDVRRRGRLPVERRHPTIEILPVASGCLSACTFCQTRLARGRLVSFRPGDLIERARRAVDEGVREIWLTSQDLGAYGRDGGTPLARLVEGICSLDGDFLVRLGMTSPIWVWQDLGDWMRLLEHPKVFKFLHVPLQSGSDAVLAAMKRGNTVRQFEEIAHAFHERFPEGTLMTDIIVGYPGETEEDFAQTLDVIRRLRPVAVNRSRFSARPGTAAARLHPIPPPVVSERSARLLELTRSIAREFHRRLVGRREVVLACENKPNGTSLAHNAGYRPVVLPRHVPPGTWLEVDYHGAADYHMKGRTVGEAGSEGIATLEATATRRSPDAVSAVSFP